MRLRQPRENFGLRDFAGRGARSLRRHGDRRAGAEHDAFQQRIARQTVGAMHPSTGHFASRE